MTESLDATIAELAELYSRTLSIADIPNICGFDFEFFISPSKVNKFLRDHMLIYSIDSENGIYIVLDLPHDEPQKLVTTAMEELLQRSKWIESEFNTQWRIESRVRSPRLPPEICGLVIEHLFDDARTLLNCCLTCHEFLHCSRQYLYMTDISLTKHQKIKSFFESLSKLPNMRPLTIHIELSSCHIKTYTEFLLHGQPLLSNLQSVHLQGMHSSSLHPSLVSIRRPFCSVTMLEFNRCTFGSVLDLRRLICNFFPNVTHLTFGDISIDSYHISLPNLAQRKPLSLSELTFLNEVPAVIPQWLLWTKMPNTLQSLSINTLDLPKMFPSCSRHLQFLRVYWITNQNELDQNVSFGADVLPTLQTLVISSLDCISDFRAFHDVLSRSTISSSLSCIQIQYLPSSHQMEEQSWRVLDDTLVQLPDHVQIKLEDKYWQFLPQLQSKAMPWDVPTLPFSE
ncbi:hypothetical protein C8Q75DRAFT_213956 [Abortiporus biennis]|nr:hypothetical protein C8Q75DRAFT_213956 [Abortiporus biennis]